MFEFPGWWGAWVRPTPPINQENPNIFRKYRRQVVKNMVHSFEEIQLTIFEKYSRRRSDLYFSWQGQRSSRNCVFYLFGVQNKFCLDRLVVLDEKKISLLRGENFWFLDEKHWTSPDENFFFFLMRIFSSDEKKPLVRKILVWENGSEMRITEPLATNSL